MACTTEQRVVLQCDSSSAVNINNEGLKKNSKYYLLCQLYLMDAIERSEVTLVGVSSASNPADIFTFEKMLSLLNMKYIKIATFSPKK